ncbi:hypothetical protein IU487_34775 [Nocardia puris]|uniref:hypothetical protein n=1 Tax=Nocardia puris TaxID=208602 RepID=UPI001893A71D|nr:hypothetical protein [Nocardia puris]MBF6216161.1 hypothetical protein [Nocardia puris]
MTFVPNRFAPSVLDKVHEAIGDRLEAEYDLIAAVVYAVGAGADAEGIRGVFAETALRGQGEWIFPAIGEQTRLRDLLEGAGVRVHAEDGTEEVLLDLMGIPLFGVTVSHHDERRAPGEELDRERMRRVAELAVPAIYGAGCALAVVDGPTITELDQEQALARFSVSEKHFGIVCPDSRRA